LKTDGTVWTWGDNAYSDLGDGTDLFRSTPVQMLFSGKTSAIAGGGNDTLVISTDPDPHFTPLARHDLVWQDTSSADLLISPWSAQLPLIPINPAPNYLVRHIQTGWRIVASPDLDGDGQPDLLWENSISGDVTYWIMDGANLRNAGSVAQGVDLSWQIVGTPDINGDGHPDILWQNTQTGDIVYWQLNVATVVGGGVIAYGVPREWQVVGTADINGDGRPDILWQSSQTGAVLVWYMVGGQYVGGEAIAKGVPDGWKIVSVQDIDGDGKPDLLWQNIPLGGVVYWLLDGARLKNNGTLSYNVPASLLGIRAH